jgi:hypothetical protein
VAKGQGHRAHYPRSHSRLKSPTPTVPNAMPGNARRRVTFLVHRAEGAGVPAAPTERHEFVRRQVDRGEQGGGKRRGALVLSPLFPRRPPFRPGERALSRPPFPVRNGAASVRLHPSFLCKFCHVLLRLVGEMPTLVHRCGARQIAAPGGVRNPVPAKAGIVCAAALPDRSRVYPRSA